MATTSADLRGLMKDVRLASDALLAAADGDSNDAEQERASDLNDAALALVIALEGL